MPDSITKKVTVSDRDIHRGTPFKSGHCPLALATKRAFGLDSVYVGPNNVIAYTTEDPREMRGPLPPKAKEFRRNFDAGDPVRSITFELTLHR